MTNETPKMRKLATTYAVELSDGSTVYIVGSNAKGWDIKKDLESAPYSYGHPGRKVAARAADTLQKLFIGLGLD